MTFAACELDEILGLFEKLVVHIWSLSCEHCGGKIEEGSREKRKSTLYLQQRDCSPVCLSSCLEEKPFFSFCFNNQKREIVSWLQGGEPTSSGSAAPVADST